MKLRRSWGPAAGLLAIVTLVACSSAGSGRAVTPAQTAGPPPTKEVERVQAVRPMIDHLTQALQSGNPTASQDAYEAYDAAWNGIEVYINVRSRALYNALEQDYESPIGDGLKASQPNFPDLVSRSQALGKKYDEAIALVEKGPPLHPLFDDLATLRIVRADLRSTSAALDSGDLAKTKQRFASFKANYPPAQELLQARSATDEQETTAALATVDAKLQQPNASAADLKPLVAALMGRYNFGVNLLNAAARNADATKASFTEADKQQLQGLNSVQLDLTKSQAAREAGGYADAQSAATAAAGPDFAAVQPALAAKASDAPLQTALTAYARLVGGPGDASKVRAAQQAAVEQVAIAQQVLVGQFWTDPRLQAFLASLPKS